MESDGSGGLDQLLARALTSDKAAEEQLFRVLRARFAAIAQRRLGEEEDAQDVAQEACMTILEKYRAADFPAGFRAWAYTVLRMKIGDRFRSVKVEQQRFCREPGNDKAPQPSAPSRDLNLRRRLVDCYKALKRVHPRYARVLNLSHQGYGSVEICRRMAITLSNLYSILSRGRSLLKKCLETGRL